MEVVGEPYIGDDKLCQKDERVAIDQKRQYGVIIQYQMEESRRWLLFPCLLSLQQVLERIDQLVSISQGALHPSQDRIASFPRNPFLLL